MKIDSGFIAGLALAGGLLLAPTDAAAQTNVKLGLGADYWTDDHGALFQINLSIDTQLAGPLNIGARFGGLVATRGENFGVPLDLLLHLQLGNRVYMEGLAGPWVMFEGDHVKAHAAFGFGISGEAVTFGIEIGYLDPSPVAGVRLGFKF